MYGQTGSGKTFTMTGSLNEQVNLGKCSQSSKCELILF